MDFDCSGLYVCDPQKNTLCNKRNCGNPCTMTRYREFAFEGIAAAMAAQWGRAIDWTDTAETDA